MRPSSRATWPAAGARSCTAIGPGRPSIIRADTSRRCGSTGAMTRSRGRARSRLSDRRGDELRPPLAGRRAAGVRRGGGLRPGSGVPRENRWPASALRDRHPRQGLLPGVAACLPVRRRRCGRVWEASDPEPGVDTWPPPARGARNERGNRQLQYVFVHACGEMLPMPRRGNCRASHGRVPTQRPGLTLPGLPLGVPRCGITRTVRAFCPNTSGCRWTDKMMSPQVHTASSAYSGHGRTLVNVPRRRLRAHRQPPGSSSGPWAAGWTSARRTRRTHRSGRRGRRRPRDRHDDPGDGGHRQSSSSKAPHSARRSCPSTSRSFGARRRRPRLRPARRRPAGSSPSRWASTSVCSALPKLDARAPASNRVERRPGARYEKYRQALAGRGLDPNGACLSTSSRVTYLAIGYTRADSGPREADLVAYKGRADRGQQSPTSCTPVRPRPRRWCSPSTGPGSRAGSSRKRRRRRRLAPAGGAHRWFAAELDPEDGQLPGGIPNAEPLPGTRSMAPRRSSGCCTTAHQVLRALAVDSGYSETGLSEYLFPYELSFAIHPNGGSEFTIGGLRTVLEQNLDEVVDRAVENATCIYDPNCMVANRGADQAACNCPRRRASRGTGSSVAGTCSARPKGNGDRVLAPGLDEP